MRSVKRQLFTDARSVVVLAVCDEAMGQLLTLSLRVFVEEQVLYTVHECNHVCTNEQPTSVEIGGGFIAPICAEGRRYERD